MIKNPFGVLTDEVAGLPELARGKPSTTGALSFFAGRVRSALDLIRQEPEILLFGALQWLIIGVGYVAWAQIFGVVPDEVWQAVRQASEAERQGVVLLANVAITVWSFFIVGLVALPIGMLSGCMGAAHILRRSGRQSTIRTCLSLASRSAWSLWAFHWIDGWITCQQILARLPKKNDQLDERIASEALYYAWKIGSAGILPALLCGSGIVSAGKSALGFLRKRFADIALLRSGYALVCWVLGIATYVIGVATLGYAAEPVASGRSVTGSALEQFIIIAGLPLLIAVAVLQLVIRPIYVIAISELYVDYMIETQQQVDLDSGVSRLGGAVAAGLALLAALVFVALFRDTLGITAYIATIIPPGQAL